MRSILAIQLRKPWLFTVDCIGRSVHWATSEGRPTFLGLAVLLGGTIASQLISVPNLFWVVPTAIALLLLLAWAWRARRSIVIDDFVDHSSRLRARVDGTASAGTAENTSVAA